MNQEQRLLSQDEAALTSFQHSAYIVLIFAAQ